jgi:FkbM family methyltransferase
MSGSDPVGLSSRLRACVGWAFRLGRNLLERLGGRNHRFVLLTPPLSRAQVVLDLDQRRALRLRTRDLVDIDVINQVFVSHDYGIHRLARGDDIRALYRQIVARGQTPLILDCGANTGMAARYFSATYPEAKICCIEPDADNLRMARLNNPGASADFLLAGIGGKDGRARLSDPGEGNWAYRVEESPDGGTEILSIASVLRRYDSARHVPFIVKMDIEGFEANVFEQDTDWLDAVPLLVVELHDWMLPRQGNSRSFLAQVARRDRDFIFFGENVFSIANTWPGESRT